MKSLDKGLSNNRGLVDAQIPPCNRADYSTRHRVRSNINKEKKSEKKEVVKERAREKEKRKERRQPTYRHASMVGQTCEKRSHL